MRNALKTMVNRTGCGAVFRWLRALFYAVIDGIGYGLAFVVGLFLAKKQPIPHDAVKKILIIRTDRIGDLVLSTPAIRAVKATYPHAQVHLLVSGYAKEIVVANPHIDKLLVCGKDAIDKGYDIAVALHPGFTQNYIAFASRARIRVGYTGWGGGFFLTHRLKDDRSIRVRHEVDSALEVVGTIGCAVDDKRMEICVTEAGEQFAVRFLQEAQLTSTRLIVVIHPGARQSYVRWTKTGFAEVADTLIKECKAAVIFTGSHSERRLIEEIASLMSRKALCAVGLRLTEVISLIKHCNLFIGNATGPMHIAAALEVSTVAVFGCLHPLDSFQTWGPQGPRAVVVTGKAECPHCHPTDCTKHYACIKSITAKEVLTAARGLLMKQAALCTKKSS